MKKIIYIIFGFIIGVAGIAFAANPVTFPANGGTGWGLPGGIQAHTILIGNGTSPFATATPSTAGFVLTSNGVSADPTFQVATGGSGNSFAWPFTVSPGGVSTSTTVGFLNGLFSTASSTFSGNLFLTALSQGGLYVGSSGKIGTFATTTVSCSGSTSCTSFTALGSSPITISSSGSTFSGPINSIVTTDGTGALMATGTQLTVGNLLATSTTATSLFLGNIGLTSPTPDARIKIGNNSTQSVDAQIVIARNVDDTTGPVTTGNGHGFSDSSVVTRSGTMAYNSYDARTIFNGANNYDHYAGYQGAENYNGTGLMSTMYGFLDNPAINNTGNITNRYGFQAGDMSVGSSGRPVNNFGFNCLADFTAGSSGNWCFYAGGRSNFMGGLVLGSNNVPYYANNAQLDINNVGTGDAKIQLENFGNNFWDVLATSTKLVIKDVNNIDYMDFLTGGNVGISSTTPGSLLSLGTSGGINFRLGTSTFGSSANGIDLSNGCFSIKGVCISGSGGGGSGIVSSGLAGQLGYYNSSGTTLVGTSTNPLYVSSLYASSTSLTNVLLGNVAVGTSTTQTSLMSRYTNNLALNAIGTDILDIGSTGLSGIVQTDRIVLKQTSASTFTNALGPGLAFSISTTSTPNGSIDLGYIGTTRSVGDFNGSVSIGAATNNTFTSTPSLTLDGGNARTSLLNSMFGVGTSTSQFALEVSSSTASQLVLGDGVNSQWAFRNAGGNLYIGTTSPTTFGTTTQQALSILSTGFVGINTATPTTALTFGAGTTAPFGINFGDATANLYRSAAGQIRTDGALVVVGAISSASISSGGSSGSIFIGTGTGDFTSVATNIANSSTAMYLFAASTGVGYRNLFGGSTMTVAPTVNANYGGNIFGASGVTLAASGNHAILANVVVTNIGQIAQSGATVGRIAALYLEGSSTPMSNSYNLYASSTQQSYFGGNVGIGTTTPYSTLGIQNVAGTDSFSIGSSTGYDLRLDKLGRFYLGKYADCSGTNNALGITSGQLICDSLVSDQQLKTNINPLVHGLDTIMALKPVTYFWKDTTDHNTQSLLEQYGFIAQQVLPVLPSAVGTTTPDAQEAVLTNGQPVYTLDKTALIAPLVQAVQELAIKGVATKRSAEENWQWIVIGLLVVWNIGLTVRRKK